jgi:hypothetical protein
MLTKNIYFYHSQKFLVWNNQRDRLPGLKAGSRSAVTVPGLCTQLIHTRTLWGITGGTCGGVWHHHSCIMRQATWNYHITSVAVGVVCILETNHVWTVACSLFQWHDRTSSCRIKELSSKLHTAVHSFMLRANLSSVLKLILYCCE